MRNGNSIVEMRTFIRWALECDDIDLFDDASRFLHQLFIFHKMRFGGNEYFVQQETFQHCAQRLIRRAEKTEGSYIPVAMRIMAAARLGDRMVLDVAREHAVIACEVLNLKPVQDCHDAPYRAQSSMPPA